MVTSISRSPSETEGIGEKWGNTAHPGLVIALCGDLGAGKTQLVKGLARGLGIKDRVTSPTFALVNTYTDGRLALFHLDLYRLDNREQIISAGLDEYLCPKGVAVIEWAERWFSEKPQCTQAGSILRRDLAIPCMRWVEIDVVSESERRITYEDFGA
jgi:tRNA threonylcarbamoyladenosine biosynthesis protein TsaE